MTADERRELALSLAVQFYDGRLTSINADGVVDVAGRFLAFLEDREPT